MTKIKKNISSIFIVPTLKISREGLKNNGFINGYIADSRKEVQYENCCYLLFKPNNIEKFRDFLDNEYDRTLHEKYQVIDDYDYEDDYVVVVYKLDPRFKEDYDKVKQGKYSKTSDKFKELFPKTLKLYKEGKQRETYSLQYRIFKKDSDLKADLQSKIYGTYEDNYGKQVPYTGNWEDHWEVWDGWDEEKEILNLDKIKENERKNNKLEQN